MSSVSVTEKPVVTPMPASFSVPLLNLLLTLALTVATLAIAGFLAREQGYEMTIVTMGWPHVILGFVFFFGKVLRGEANMRRAFALLGLLTLAIWIVHYNYAITGLIYLYFLYHAFRDEIFVFLQTRARHPPRSNVLAIAGVAPAILLLLLLPQQKSFRHDLRRTEFTNTEVSQVGWSLIPFKAVPNSRGREFYFYLEAPQTTGSRAFTTQATTIDTRSDGTALVNDRNWPQAADLVFLAHYANSTPATLAAGDVPVLLTGGHRVGQTFRAEQDNLDGIWMRIDPLEPSTSPTNFVLHLASPPLLPYPGWLEKLRLLLLVLLSAVVLWKLLVRPRHNPQLWICLVVVVVGLYGTQAILKSSNNAGYHFPLIFQFVVVFHYWSWYVFSFDKLRALPQSNLIAPPSLSAGWYNHALALLRPPRNFWLTVIILNLVSAAGVFWYYKLGGPLALRFAFDYNYFLYFLVFHVTFSFIPRPRAFGADRSPSSAAEA
jgi:hypothetical protein